MKLFGVLAIWAVVVLAASMFLNAGHYVMAFVLVFVLLLGTKVN